jgi:uncharacterized lipoprotein YmbA
MTSGIRTGAAIAALFLAPVLAACATSPENHYYVLTPTPIAEARLDKSAGAPPDLSVTVPAYLDRAQIIFIDATGEAEIHEFDRWAEPIDGMIRRVLTQDMQAQPGPGKTIHRVVSLTIDTFAFGNGQATLKAHWTLSPRSADKGRNTTVVTHDFAQSEAVAGDDMTAAVVAMSHLLGNLAQSIAASLP